MKEPNDILLPLNPNKINGLQGTNLFFSWALRKLSELWLLKKKEEKNIKRKIVKNFRLKL